MSTIREIKYILEQQESIKISCGQGMFREVCLSEYKNSTEAAIAVMDCAKYSPCTCAGCENWENPCTWEERIILRAFP